jgi:hypothetical protein
VDRTRRSEAFACEIPKRNAIAIKGTTMRTATVRQTAEQNVEQRYFDYVQAGKYIGKSAEAVRKYVSYGWLKAHKQGRKLRWISKAELDRFMAG